MLNGDVLTDIDLTAQIAQHEADGRARRRSRWCRSTTRRPTASCACDEDNAVRGFVEKPAADQIDTNRISAGAYVLERSVLDLIPPDRNVSIEREVWPRLVGEGLYGFPPSAYWLDIGTPERYLQGTFDILEGNVRTAVAERLGDGYLAVDDGARRTGASCRPRSSSASCTIAEARTSGRSSCSARASRSARARPSSARSCSTAPTIGARCRAARLHRRGRRARSATARRSPGGAVLGEGVTSGRGTC